jgi:glycine C-acetyltransferase/8-amino-7-oxononanoate synthase
MESPPGPRIVVDGEVYLYFGGTSYHCLHADECAMQAGIDAWRRYGTNTATSRRNLGTSPVHAQLEQDAAAFFGEEDAAYLASGYLLNTAAVEALALMRGVARIYIDEFAHFSLWNAARATGLPLHPFEHRSPAALTTTISSTLAADEHPLIISDGLFPGTGAIAPVDAYTAIAESVGGELWIDDSHGIGVLGPGGRGTLAYLGIHSERAHYGGTLSKAFGGFGGLIPASGDFIACVQSGATMIGASPVPTPIAAATLQCLQTLNARPELCETLQDNVRYFRDGLQDLGINLAPTPSPIVTFCIGDAALMQLVQTTLWKRHIAIQYADNKYPAIGPQGALRIVIFSAHSREHLDELLENLGIAIQSSRSAGSTLFPGRSFPA